MGWTVDYIQHHRSGRKSFRRVYPEHLRPYLGRTQLRVSIGWPNEPGFLSKYEAASAEWHRNVDLAERKHAGEFDTLNSPTIAYLAEVYRVEAVEMDDTARWDPTERDLHRGVAAQLQAAGISHRSPWSGLEGGRWAGKTRYALEVLHGRCQAMRALGDLDAIVEWWREEALDLVEAQGYVFDPSDTNGFATLCRALNDAAISAGDDKLRRLSGEGYPDTPLQPERPVIRDDRKSSVPLVATYDVYAAVKNIKPGGRREGRNYLKNLIDFVGHDDAARLTRDDVVRWRDHLIGEASEVGKVRKPVTVRDKYLMTLRCTLGWAFDELKTLPANVATDVKVHIPKQAKVRDKDFTLDEARSILRATLVAPSGQLSAPSVRARRWIPWLCAYTGCRVNEMSQLRKEDVLRQDGIWIVNITPEAGDVKAKEFRATPLHPHLIEQEFLAMVRGLPDGPLFYDPGRRRATGTEDNRHIKKVGERLAKWVREEVGITDPNLKPNHAWRHLFKTLSAEAGIEERIADAIQGHAPGTTGRKYGKVNIQTKWKAMAMFPRFDLDADNQTTPY